MELDTYIRFVLALVFVLALIGTIGWAVRRYGAFGAQPRTRGRFRRLRIVEVAPVDAKRKLVLVRRDDTEHLLLLGAGPDVLVESGIVPPAPPAGAEGPQ
jgi:flagellar protein FliO/FliZ